MDKFAELYTAEKARRHLDKGRVVIFACGLGSPYFCFSCFGKIFVTLSLPLIPGKNPS